MRSYTTAQDTVLSGSSYQVSTRALVANADGTMIDLTSVGGIDWFDKIDLDTTIDQAVSQATITLRRGAGPTLSLSPFRSDSTVNVNGVGSYAPLVDLGRKIEIDVATTATGVAPVSADWQPLFVGYIDTIDFGSDPITIVARDLGAALVDRWLESDATYGTGPGRAIELVMQDILDAAFGAGVVPLYTPTSPGFLITSYTQKSMGVMAALTALAGTIGWDVRYAWDSGASQFRLTFAQPPRTATTSIYTFGPSRYIDVTKLTLDRTNIRNAIGVDYPVFDIISGAEARAQITTVIDTTSVAKYGRRYMGITEPSGSPINTQTKAQNLAAAALADLKSPPAEQEIELHFDWRVELHDLDTFTANGVHYNTDQKWAVAGVRHTLEPTKHRTRITARGAPAGSYLSWIGRGPNGAPVGKPVPPIAKITPGTNTGSSYLDLTFDATPGVGGSTLLHFKITIKKGGTTAIALDDVINILTLPYTDTFTRDPQMALVAMFVVTDATTGLSSAPAFYTIESSRNYINGSGQPIRSQPWSDGNYSTVAIDSSGYNLHSSVTDSSGLASRSANRFFAKGLSGNPDQLDSIPDGASYARAYASRINAGRPIIDFSESIHSNKTADNIGDGATYGITAKADRANLVATVDASGVVAGKILRSRALDDGKYAVVSSISAGTYIDSGVSVSTGAAANKMFAKGLSGDPDTADSISNGSTNRVTTLNEATGGGRGYSALDVNNRIADQSHIPMVRVSSGGATPFYGGGNTTNCISTVTYSGGLYTANIPAWVLYAGSFTKSYNSGSVAGLGQNLTYYIYCDDPNYAGGAVTYYASTTLYAPTNNDGRVYVGAVTTGSGGSASTTYSGGAAACFEGDTLIAMVGGTSKPIAEIVAGDVVVSFDPATGVLGTKRVTAVQVHEVKGVLTIETDHGRVVTTPEHPFYLEGGAFGAAGWLRHGNYVMRLSEFGLLRADRVLSVNPDKRAVTVYNFEVEDWHTYIANGFAVHNVKLI